MKRLILATIATLTICTLTTKVNAAENAPSIIINNNIVTSDYNYNNPGYGNYGPNPYYGSGYIPYGYGPAFYGSAPYMMPMNRNSRYVTTFTPNNSNPNNTNTTAKISQSRTW